METERKEESRGRSMGTALVMEGRNLQGSSVLGCCVLWVLGVGGGVVRNSQRDKFPQKMSRMWTSASTSRFICNYQCYLPPFHQFNHSTLSNFMDWGGTNLSFWEKKWVPSNRYFHDSPLLLHQPSATAGVSQPLLLLSKEHDWNWFSRPSSLFLKNVCNEEEIWGETF